MNINVYIEDDLGDYLNQHAKKTGKSRNALIREAIKEWISHQGVKKWPRSVLKFSGIKESPAFESFRDELLEPKEDPLS